MRQICVSCHSYKRQLSHRRVRSGDSTTSSLSLILNQTACCQQWSLVWTAKPIFGTGKANLDCVTISGLTRQQKSRFLIHKCTAELSKNDIFSIFGRMAKLQYLGGWVVELGSCVLAINLFCVFLVLVLVSLQTTHVLWVYYVYNSWVV